MISTRAYCDALRAVDQESVRVAKLEVDRHLLQLNDLNARMERERGEFLRVDAYERRHEVLADRVDRLETWQSNITGRLIVFSVLGLVVVGATSALVTHVLGG